MPLGIDQNPQPSLSRPSYNRDGSVELWMNPHAETVETFPPFYWRCRWSERPCLICIASWFVCLCSVGGGKKRKENGDWFPVFHHHGDRHKKTWDCSVSAPRTETGEETGGIVWKQIPLFHQNQQVYEDTRYQWSSLPFGCFIFPTGKQSVWRGKDPNLPWTFNSNKSVTVCVLFAKPSLCLDVLCPYPQTIVRCLQSIADGLLEIVIR